MSDSLIAFQPAIEDPSNIRPSVRLSSSITPEAMVRCCHLPLGSVKRRSTQSISSSLMRESTLPASFAIALPLARPAKAGLRLTVRPQRKTHWVPAFAWKQRFDSSLGETDSRAARESQGGSEYFTGVERADRLIEARFSAGRRPLS